MGFLTNSIGGTIMAKLYFKYGTMNSSKSAQLIMVNHNYLEQGKDTLIFKPKLDTRDGNFIKSRALNTQVSAILVESNQRDFMFRKTQEILPNCVLIDEVQFMPSHQIEELARIVDLLNVPVICFGLMTDFQSNLFEGSRRLVELGAILQEIKTVCWYCKSRAVFNMRLIEGVPTFDGEQIDVGGNEKYRPVCRKCYRKARNRGLHDVHKDSPEGVL